MNRYDDYDGIPMHADTCYYCSGDSPVDGADHADTHPCVAIGHQYGTASEDHVCYGCGEQATDPAMIDPAWHEHQERAYRAADFFGDSDAARDDITAGAYPSLSPTPIVLAERFRLVDGYSESAPERARIVGTYGLGYLVKFLSDGTEALAFPSEIQTLR